MADVARNNAFGIGSPSWNLSFPEGNLTALEIITYFPHWLKSVDVILRFVNHGGRAVVITGLLGTTRIMPNGSFAPNSTTVMMQYAMRRAGYEEWTIGTRHEWEVLREYDENSLYVGDFRPPRLTHPKSGSVNLDGNTSHLARNQPAAPIPFKDLALHVKQHPSGEDALDLTRCVDYALKHPQEKWLFPTDFVKLVKRLGGPLPVTHSHLDRQLFARYDKNYPAHNEKRTPAKYNRKSTAKPKTKPKSTRTDVPADKSLIKKKITRYTDDSVMAESPSSTAGKRAIEAVGDTQGNGRRKRRSSRRVKKTPVYTEKDEDTTDIDTLDPSHPGYATLIKSQKPSRIPPTPKDEESEFEAKDEPESDDNILPAIDEALDSDLGTPETRGKRSAARRARQTIQEQSSAALMEQFHAAAATAKPAHQSIFNHGPEMMAAARAYEHRRPVFLPPPTLSANRMIIDPYTVHLYAQDGCRNEAELWASALSMYRFGGPRRHPPFRELYRLTDPLPWDTSDWAENVRWAKEQYTFFGVTTWTEYDDHLERITEWRYRTMWVSEEVVVAGV